MASAYPTGLDNHATNHVDNVDEKIAAAVVNNIADAINKMQIEMGTVPKGSRASVKTRIQKLEGNATTIGYADLAPPTILPDSTFGMAEVSSGWFVTEAGVLPTGMPSSVTAVTCYKSFIEAKDDGQSSANTKPELDTDSDNSRSALCVHSINTILGAGKFLQISGVDITDSFGCKIPDISLPEYQRAAALSMIGMCDRYGITDIRFDTVNDIIIGTGGIATLPDGVASYEDWENRFILPACRTIFNMLRARGIRVWINGVGGSDTASGSYHGFGAAYDNRGDGRLRWMKRLAPYVDGFMHEFAFQGSDNNPLNDSYRVTQVLSTYKDWWSYWLRVPALACQLGKGYLMFVYNFNNGQSYRFSRASALLEWDGKTPMFLVVSEGIADTNPTYKWDTGFPIGPHKVKTATSNYIHTRQFDKGTLVLNATAVGGGSITVNGHAVPAGDAWFDTGNFY